MINAFDIRKGNALLHEGNDVNLLEIRGVEATLMIGNLIYSAFYEDLEPIELDEDRLTSMGFEPIGTTSNTEYFVQEMAGVDVEIDLDIKRLLIGGVQFQFNGYLHELQNALYLLKGE